MTQERLLQDKCRWFINKIKQLFIHANEYRRSVFGQFDI